ncbi:MAG: response regulator [Desulfobacterium sp.]|nr:response regulator [Desulfobacterium sp.]
MKQTLRTKAVLYTIFIVVVTSIISATGSSLLNISQTKRDNQKRLQTALNSFERHFTEIPAAVDKQFRIFSNEKNLAIQTLQTARMGWDLEIGLSFAGTFGKYDELLIKNGVLDRFGFYFAPLLKGDEQLALYYSKALGGLVQVESGNHFQRLNFGRKKIEDPGLFPPVHTPTADSALVIKAGELFLVVQSEYALEDSENSTSTHIGTFVFEKRLGLDLNVLDDEMGVKFSLYDVSGTFGAGGVHMPDLLLEKTAFSRERILKLADLNGTGYDSLLSPLFYGEKRVGYISVKIPQAATTLKIKETIKVLAWLSLSIVLGVILISWFLVTRLTRPILELTRAASEIANGNLNQEISVTGKDELGSLAVSFAHMRDAVRGKIQEIQEKNIHLTKAEQNYRGIFENAMEGIFQTTPAGELLTANPAFAQILGYDTVEDALTGITNMEAQLYVDATDRENLKKILETHKIVKGFETKIYRKDGSMIDVSINARRKFDNSNNLLFFEGALEDISERKRTEALRIEKEAAEAATQTKSDFLANMSHEIRTPMNAIIGLTYLILNTKLTGKQYDYMKSIETSSHSLLRIINDILDFSKIEAGKLQMEYVAFSLDEVLTSLSNTVSIKAHEKDVEFLISVDHKVPNFLVGDPLRLGQVLVNLSSNAVKFTDSGEIVIRIEMADEAPAADSSQTMLKFSIEDSGIGLSKEEQDGLFQRFTQADSSTTRKYGGTGLGLTICKRLTEMMGGKIFVESESGKGSTFTFTASLGLQTDKKEKVRKLPENFSKLKILIVDDNPTSRTIFEDMLITYTSVSQAASAKEAISELRVAAKENRPYDIVLMDWKMPGMDGIEATREINRDVQLAAVKPSIILATAYGRQEVMEQAKDVGADGFLIKPVNASMIFDVIMDVVNKQGATLSGPMEPQRDELTALKALGHANILLVEDNEINQQVAMELLKQADVDVTVANNGEESLTAVDKADFQIIFMDIQMPKMDGYEATRRLREMKVDIPIIAMTAHAMVGERERCLQAGMNDYIPKPIDPPDLYAKLIKWISQKDRIIKTDALARPEKAPASLGDVVILPESIPGIDMDAGLKRVAGNRKLYRDLLRSFREKYADVAAEVVRELKMRNYETAGRLVHTVKGVGGNLGATHVYTSASALESSILQGKAEEFNGLSQAFGDTIKVVMEGLPQLDDGHPEETDHRLGPDDAVDFKTALPLLKDLADLLESDLIAAMDTIGALAPLIGASPMGEHYKRLKEQVDNFDTDNASNTLSEIIQQIESAE